MDKKSLTNIVFSFGRLGGKELTKHFGLEADGTIDFGGKQSPNEMYWSVEDNDLIILDSHHHPTTRFFNMFTALEQDGKAIGTYLPASSVKHYLKIELIKNNSLQLESYLDVVQVKLNQLQKELEYNQNNLENQLILSRRDTRKNSKPRIAFILNATQTIDQWIALIKKVQEDNRFDVRVITQNRVFRDKEQKGTKEILTAKLEQVGIIYVDNGVDYEREFKNLIKWNPDYVFRQSEWDGDWPSIFSSANFYWTKLIHIPYVVTDDFIGYQWNKDKTLFEVPHFGNFWRSYIPVELPERVKGRLRRTYTAEGIFVAVGSIKAREIKKTEAKWFTETDSKRLIWMPHHSIGNFSTFDVIYTKMLDWAKNHPEISICFKPHPSLPSVIKSMPQRMSWKQWEDFLKEWEKLPNTAFIIDESSYPYVAASDVVMSDGVSILYEAQILEKPIVYNESERHEPFTPTGDELIQGVHREKSFEAAMDKVLYLFDNSDPLKSKQEENMRPYLAIENPETNIIDDLMSDWNSEKGEKQNEPSSN